MTPEDELARKRFMVLQLIRWGGVALVLLGVAVLAGKLAWPQAAGYVLVVLGAIDVLLLPPLIARRWRTPRS
jgi:hypothetical protein